MQRSHAIGWLHERGRERQAMCVGCRFSVTRQPHWRLEKKASSSYALNTHLSYQQLQETNKLHPISLWVQSTVHLISPFPPISYKLVLFEPPTWKKPRMYWSSQVQMYQALEKGKSQEESFISVNSTLIVAEIVLITDKTFIFDQFTCVMFCYEPDMPKVHD